MLPCYRVACGVGSQSEVAIRVAELEAANIQDRAQQAARQGDWAQVRRLLAEARRNSQHNEWLGYSYEWNKAQTDAALVDREGADRVLANGKPWRILACGPFLTST